MGVKSIVSVVALLFPASAAVASSTGISSYSGKQGTNCSQCHEEEGILPIVRFQGPEELTAGTSANFLFVIESQAALQDVGGFNVAVSAGTVEALPGMGTRLEVDELTHDAPKAVDEDGVTSWEFVWDAPPMTGPQTLFGYGNSANGNGTTGGDAAAGARFVVNVVAPPRRGDANCDGALTAADVSAVLQERGITPPSCALADADCDGGVNDADVPLIIAALFDPDPLPACP